MSRWVRRLYVGVLPWMVVAGPVTTAAQQEPMLVVDFDPALSIRQLADDYLGDADLWPEILKASGVATVVELQPGQKLRIPVSQVTAAIQAVALSQEEIQRANQAGAQLFAPRIIARAISIHDDALIKRTLGAWLEVFQLAQRSRTTAGEAYEVCQQQRNQAAEARLSDKQGSVEGQKPRELVWDDRRLDAILIEEEKLRTLSDSTAQITFRDASRLRLNPNSQAVIQRMRVDPLTREEDAKVSLIEGDFYALLADRSERKHFDVEIPDVQATIDSGNFWVSNDSSGAKFTNYDADPVHIAARGETVILGRNEGALVRSGDTSMRKVDVLPAPQQEAPRQGHVAIAGQIELRWTAVTDAAGYWLEIGFDPSFDRMAATHWGLPEARFQADALEPGIYYWRIAALDRFDLPGARSEAWRLEVRSDTVPPYLLIEQPEPGDILRQAPVVVAGQSEPGAQLTIDGVAVEIDADGRFQHRITPPEGDNTFALQATDAAGNQTTKTHRIGYMPDRPAELVFARSTPRLAPDHFLSNNGTLSLAGRTLAQAHLRIEAADGSALAQGYAGATGQFRINIPLREDYQDLIVRVIAPSGFVTTSRFAATIDRVAPEIVLDEPLPRLTTDTGLQLRGELSEAATLRLNGHELTVEEGRFARRIELAEGRNPIELVATDAAGNVRVSKWTVRLDKTPPELVDHRISTVTDARGTTLHVSVTVEDASGVARVAPFTIATRGRRSSGFLRYDRAAHRYQGTVDVASADAADARLQQVELTDDAGNGKIFSLD